MLYYVLAVLLVHVRLNDAAVDISGLPKCAQDCLSKNIAAQTQCQVLDVACLCTNAAYVSSSSCCLSTTCTIEEQRTAIQFNQQECGKVNQTAPDFLGCSPFGLSSTVVIGGSDSTPVQSPIWTASQTSTTLTAATDPLVSIITGNPITEAASLSNIEATTATFTGQALFTGSCTSPLFAIVTDARGSIMEFPVVGCAAGRKDCCPYDVGSQAVVTKCPHDYFPTGGGCCPLGYQVYYTAIGAETPCYSVLTTKLVPASTPTMSGLTLITDRVFAHKFQIAEPLSGAPKLSTGALVGIVLAVVVVVATTLALLWYRRHRMKKTVKVGQGAAFPPNDPVLPMLQPQSPHELPSPESRVREPMSPRSPQTQWPILPRSSPPAYDHKSRPLSEMTALPQELPGSTFILEHRPALTDRQRANTEMSHLSTSKAPATPTKSPHPSEVNSLQLTPASSAYGTRSPPIISPLASPKLPSM